MSIKHPRIFHAELSGHWLASAGDLTGALDSLFGEHSRNVVTMTELSPHKFRIPLERYCKAHNLHLHHPKGSGKNECAVISKLPFRKRKAWRLTPLRIPFGRTAPIYLVAVRLKIGPWIGVWHSPAHNDGLSKRGKAGRFTRVYVSALAGLRVARMKMRHGRVLLTGDWNENLVRPAMQRILGKGYPVMKWAVRKGQKPTITGKRVIDGVLTNLTVVKMSRTLWARFHGFDHRAVLTDLA